MNLVFIGPPAAGKGTQARIISTKFGLYWIAVGEILRERAKIDDALGQKIRQYQASGRLLPKDGIVGVLSEALSRTEAKAGFILDGFPRNLEQAEIFAVMLKQLGIELSVVIKLDLDEAEIVKRIMGRIVCSSCKANYHEQYNLPKIAGVCDFCGGTKFSKRADDTLEVVKSRIAEYQQTEKMADYYADLGLLRVIRSGGNIAEVTKQIEEVIKEL